MGQPLTPVEQHPLFKPAVALCIEAHDKYALKGENRFRRDGVTPYSSHPIEAANLARAMGFEFEVPFALLFHDVLEDTYMSARTIFESLERHYPSTVIREMIDVVTRVTNPDWDGMASRYDKVTKPNRATRKTVMLEKYQQVINPTVLIIKSIDRICNVRDLDPNEEPEHKGRRSFFELYAEESIRLMHVLHEQFNNLPYFGVRLTTSMMIVQETMSGEIKKLQKALDKHNKKGK